MVMMSDCSRIAAAWAPCSAFVLALSLAAAPACQGFSRGTASSVDRTGSAEPALDLVTERAWPPPYADDVLWRRAQNGTDFDAARLAHRESAQTLLGAVRQGGSLGRTALRALSYASDRHAARAALCELTLGASRGSLEPLLETLYDCVAASPVTEESFEPRADEACRRQLSELAERSSLAPVERDRISASLSALRRD